MSDNDHLRAFRTEPSRRKALKRLGAGALGLGAGLAMPWIARAATPIAIGFPVPLTGPYSLEANDQVLAAQLAVDAFNADGGVNGRPVQLLVRDDRLSPGAAAFAARQLIQQDGARFIIGSLSATVQLSVAHMASQMGALYISISQSDAINEASNASSLVFHEAMNPHMTSQAVGHYAFPRLGPRIAYLVADYAYGHEMARGMRRVGRQYARETVVEVRHPIATPDFKAFLPTALEAGADVLCLCNFGRDQLNALRDLRELGVGAGLSVVAPVLLYHQRLAGGAAMYDGVLGATNYHWTLEQTLPGARAFNDAFRARHGRPPSDYGAYGYGGVSALLSAMRKADSLDPRDVANALRTLEYSSYKDRQWYRACDGQSVQSVYVVQSKAEADMQGAFDVFHIRHTQEADEVYLRGCRELGY